MLGSATRPVPSYGPWVVQESCLSEVSPTLANSDDLTYKVTRYHLHTGRARKGCVDSIINGHRNLTSGIFSFPHRIQQPHEHLRREAEVQRGHSCAQPQARTEMALHICTVHCDPSPVTKAWQKWNSLVCVYTLLARKNYVFSPKIIKTNKIINNIPLFSLLSLVPQVKWT
jgi:hypothetical protein